MSDKLSDKMDALYGGYAKTIAKQNCRIADLERQLAEARENAFILALDYTRDSRPPRHIVRACLAYEARKPK